MKTINTFEAEKDKIKELQEQAAKLCEPIYAEIDKLNRRIGRCTHPVEHIIEGNYIPDNSWGGGHATPPFRVCTICGYAEEGWGCGYYKLGPGVYDEKIIRTVKRREAEKFVTRRWSQEQMSKARRG